MMRVCILLALALPLVVIADESIHRFTDGEKVVVWVNKIGPYNNPQETYTYYTLPFCKSPEYAAIAEERKWGGLGEVLEGNELTKGDLDIRFKVKVDKILLCEQKLDETQAQFFNYAVENHYWYQLYMDDLPIWGMVGDTGGEEDIKHHDADKHASIAMFTHKKFSIGYNGDQIIDVTMTWDSPVAINTGSKLSWTYSVEWHETDVPFSKRFHKYLDNDFFEHQIHWFSIFNSFMMVVFLTGLVSLILMRTLRNDYARFAQDSDDIEDMSRDMVDEFGWKQLQGDVFRHPPYMGIFSALIAVGVQLVTVILSMILLAIAGTLYSGRGQMINVFVLCYCVTCLLAGFISGGHYAKSKGTHWIRTMVFTSLVFPAITIGIAFPLNFIAWAYTSLAAIPFGTMVVISLLWGFVAFPLTLVGTVLGRNWNGQPNAPCRVNAIPRPIPEKKWFLQTPVVILLGGILPFGSIFIEMYFVFTSFWNYKFYYVYGFMLLVFVILCIVATCVTIVSTYFLLNAEDYRWPWTSFLSAASTALYVFCYGIYYFFAKTKMYGFFQTMFYFGYMTMFSLTLAVVCGGIGHWGAYFFVRRIYQNIKGD